MADVQAVVYVDGKVVSESLEPTKALAEATARGGLAWVTMSAPGDDEILSLGSALGLHTLGLHESLRGHERSKLERYGEDVFLVLQPARYDDATESVQCREVDVFAADHLILTITSNGAHDVELVQRRLQQHPEVLRSGPLAVLWAVSEDVSRGYREVLDGIENDIDEIEEELFGDDEGVSRRIFALQREVIDLHHATAPLAEILDRLQAYALAEDHPDQAPAFREVADRARYIDGRVTAFRQTLDNALTIHATLVDQRRNDQMREMTQTSLDQNDQVKKISSWAAIGFAPTLVAGIYGMNFRFMPELDQPWGYPFALALMAAVSAGLYVAFKKKGWL